ncbi:hypothetical protein [Solibacillus sp. FSL K6-1523]|uniref:hypothetical protein n=1 Tax=Solibacillus sp. FSL K6-1523 TaxID=2921471 RepID=UPI0030F594F7
MHIPGNDYLLVSLNHSEIDTIISNLEIGWFEWNEQEAGVLLAQFKHLKYSLIQKQTNVPDNSV